MEHIITDVSEMYTLAPRVGELCPIHVQPLFPAERLSLADDGPAPIYDGAEYVKGECFDLGQVGHCGSPRVICV